MNRIETDMYRTKGLSTGTHKSFQIHFCLWEEFIKRILTHLSCKKFNEISIDHADIQKHVSYEEWLK